MRELMMQGPFQKGRKNKGRIYPDKGAAKEARALYRVNQREALFWSSLP